MKKTHLIVIRHGETEFNRQKRLQGHRDSPLTEVGVEQARTIEARLMNVHLDAIYSSDLGRAVTTSSLIWDSVRTDPRLRERSLGAFEGLTWEEVESQYPSALSRYKCDPDFEVPEGESLRQLYVRTVAVFEEIAEAWPGGRVVIVTHGGVLSCLFRYVVGIALDVPRRFKLANAALNLVEVKGGEWAIRTWGDIGQFGADYDQGQPHAQDRA